MSEDTSKWRGFELAVAGTNLSPADIPARQLVELLEAAMSVLETIAEERGASKPKPRLVAVTTGSAAYQLKSPDPAEGALIEELARQIESRGSHSSPAVRRGIDRLHRAGRSASIRFKPIGVAKVKKSLFVAPPIELVAAPYDSETELTGRVVGVNAGRLNRVTVRIRLDDGMTQEFEAEQAVAARAAKLFLQMVLAAVSYSVGADEELPGELIDIRPCELVDDEDLLREFDAARDRIADFGPMPRASDWLGTLDSDE